MIKVILADDHAVMRKVVQQVLERSDGIEVTGVAEDGQEALALVQVHKPDVLVADFAMPKLSGVEVAKAVVTQGLRTRMLILSLFTDPHLVRSALENGAHGYVTKKNIAEHLVKAIKCISAGDIYLCPFLAKVLASGK